MWSLSGEIAAVLSGLSVWYVFKMSKVSKSRRTDFLSKLAVMMVLPSLSKSIIWMDFSCTFTSFKSFPLAASNFLTIPSSQEVTNVLFRGPHMALVILPGCASEMHNTSSCCCSSMSLECFRIRTAGGVPMKASVVNSKYSSPKLKLTLLHGISNLNVKMHSPVVKFHNFTVESAEAVTSLLLSLVMSHDHVAPLCPLYVPILSPVSAYHNVGR
mmetsp:Transcript_1354/g.3889  ORF Transcript_1354/g.3889 Transcript_1354/m.3889 type:complete len:214 (+) Transcript_1354:276-917(+)